MIMKLIFRAELGTITVFKVSGGVFRSVVFILIVSNVSTLISLQTGNRNTKKLNMVDFSLKVKPSF